MTGTYSQDFIEKKIETFEYYAPYESIKELEMAAIRLHYLYGDSIEKIQVITGLYGDNHFERLFRLFLTHINES